MNPTLLAKALISSGALTLTLGGTALAAPCRANPCAPRSARTNPCAAASPCAAAMVKMDVRSVMRPASYRSYQGDQKALVTDGKKLFRDIRLSSNGLACSTCHENNSAFQDTFAQPYPHYVQMTHERAGVKAVHLDEMVQFCMVVPMASKPLPWNSKRLAALTAYASSLQKDFRTGNAYAVKNPCAAANPCASKNPCAVQRH